MTDKQRTDRKQRAQVTRDLKIRAFRLIDAIVDGGEDGAARDDRSAAAFQSLLTRVRDLWHRKLAMEGTKSETRDLLGEVVFSRLRQAFRAMLEDRSAVDELRAAEWVMGMLFSTHALTDFARAVDRVILAEPRSKDFSFAGKSNFISIPEVLQLLATGRYDGMLALESEHNRIDVFIRAGRVVLLDPHHIERRVLPASGSAEYRVIPLDMVRRAEALKAADGSPLLVGLVQLGCVGEDEASRLLEVFGLEVLFDFLAETEPVTFFYRKLETMPDFVAKYGHPMAVTPILLEASKRTDDGRAMRALYPDPDVAVRPTRDAKSRLTSMDLSVLEIKIITMISKGASPRQLARHVGLPLFNTYQHLVRFAHHGVIQVAGGRDQLADVADTLEQTIEKAFEVLDANDDELSRSHALQDALGDPFEAGGDETFLDLLAAKDVR